MEKPDTIRRAAIGVLCAAGLLAVYLLQRWDLAGLLHIDEKLSKFVFNRSVRFVLNDLLALGVIYALFPSRKYVIFSVIVQGFGLVFFLVPYLVLKSYLPSYNGPLINFLHRLILNPTLSLLLIPAFYYKKLTDRANPSGSAGR